MPIYEYECQHCGAVFERLQKLSDPDPVRCEACGHGPVKKLISRSGFVLKGSGFYTNEYPSAKRREGFQSEKEVGKAKAAPAPPAPKKETP